MKISRTKESAIAFDQLNDGARTCPMLCPLNLWTLQQA
jgi:hypothetical protein